MEGKRLDKDLFSIDSFWGKKKGIPEIHNLFRFLERMFEFKDRFHFY
jgi:hypothetical protein